MLKEHDVNGRAMLKFTEDNWREVGFKSVSHRVNLMDYVRKLADK
jgi:hypothetical protein